MDGYRVSMKEMRKTCRILVRTNKEATWKKQAL